MVRRQFRCEFYHDRSLNCLPYLSPPSLALFSMIAFIIVTDLFRTSGIYDFAYTKFGMAWHLYPLVLHHLIYPSTPGPAWFINLLSWHFNFIIVFGVIWTGKAADKGHKWAAGNRAYTRIADRE